MTGSRRPWLAPLVPLYRLATAARAFGLHAGLERVNHLRSPVVSIGSLSAGGAGKTPLVIALARALSHGSTSLSALWQGSTRAGALSQGSTSSSANRMPSCIHIDVLSRGYGRLHRGPARVDPDGTVAEFGDEPLEIARATGLPVYVAAERYQAGLLAERDAGLSARSADRDSSPVGRDASPVGRDFSPGKLQAEQEGASAPAEYLSAIHLLDDGFQHRQLHRDIDIVLFSRHDLNDRLLPFGNLREPLSALRRAAILAVPAEDANLVTELNWTGPVWRLHRRMEVPLVESAPLNSSVVAFCGIARPDQFFLGLEAAGLHLAARIAFPDHHRYAQADIARLRSTARSAGAAAFLTTEKDRVRLLSLAAPLAAQLSEEIPLNAARLHIEIEDEDAALDALLASLPPVRD